MVFKISRFKIIELGFIKEMSNLLCLFKIDIIIIDQK